MSFSDALVCIRQHRLKTYMRNGPFDQGIGNMRPFLEAQIWPYRGNGFVRLCKWAAKRALLCWGCSLVNLWLVTEPGTCARTRTLTRIQPPPPRHHCYTNQSAWYPAVAEPATKNFTTEPAAIKVSYNHQSNDDASLQQLVRDPNWPLQRLGWRFLPQWVQLLL